MKVCPIATHEAIKNSPLWSSLAPLGYQNDVGDDGRPNGRRFEVRNCKCGSTLYKPDDQDGDFDDDEVTAPVAFMPVPTPTLEKLCSQPVRLPGEAA